MKRTDYGRVDRNLVMYWPLTVHTTPALSVLRNSCVVWSYWKRFCTRPSERTNSNAPLAILHVDSLSPYWPRLASVLLFGIAAQVARIKTGSIWPGVAMHFAWNAFSFLPALFQ